MIEESWQSLEQLLEKDIKSFYDLVEIYNHISAVAENKDRSISFVFNNRDKLNATFLDSTKVPQSLLSLAISNHNSAVIEILLKAPGYDANKVLHDIIFEKRENPQLTELVFKYADPNTFIEGKTLGMLAVKYDRPEILKMIVNNPKTDLLAQDNNPDFQAINIRRNGPGFFEEEVELLNRLLIAWDWPPMESMLLMHRNNRLTWLRDARIVDAMLTLNITMEQILHYYEGGCTVLDHAIQQNKPEMVEIIGKSPKFPITLNSPNFHSRTPVMTAIHERKFKIATNLMKHNPDLHSVNGNRETILYQSLDRWRIMRQPLPAWRLELKEFIKLILSHPKIEDIINTPTNISAQTPLMRAIEWGMVEEVESICKKGANRNAKNQNGDTALHILAYTNQITPDTMKILDILFRYGVDINIKNNDGKTAYDLAQGKKEITDRIEEIDQAAWFVNYFGKEWDQKDEKKLTIKKLSNYQKIRKDYPALLKKQIKYLHLQDTIKEVYEAIKENLDALVARQEFDETTALVNVFTTLPREAIIERLVKVVDDSLNEGNNTPKNQGNNTPENQGNNTPEIQGGTKLMNVLKEFKVVLKQLNIEETVKNLDKYIETHFLKRTVIAKEPVQALHDQPSFANLSPEIQSKILRFIREDVRMDEVKISQSSTNNSSRTVKRSNSRESSPKRPRLI